MMMMMIITIIIMIIIIITRRPKIYHALIYIPSKNRKIAKLKIAMMLRPGHFRPKP